MNRVRIASADLAVKSWKERRCSRSVKISESGIWMSSVTDSKEGGVEDGGGMKEEGEEEGGGEEEETEEVESWEEEEGGKEEEEVEDGFDFLAKELELSE